MSEQPHVQATNPDRREVPAADPGQQAPSPAAGAGEHVDPDVIESAPGEEESAPVTNVVRDHTDPPFRTPDVGSDSPWPP
jgi:hypothetical protein